MRIKISPSIIRNFISTNFSPFKESGSGELRINSPFADDKKFHCYINIEKGVVHDFKLNKGMDFVSFVGEYLQIQKKEVIPTLIREYSTGNVKNFLYSEFVEKKVDLVLPEGIHFFNNDTHGLVRDAAYNYLKNRKIPENIIDEELGYIYEPSSEFDRRIFIPFYENGVLVYFIARDFTGTDMVRYKNPHGLNSKNFVYNIDKIEDEVFIFEGVFDVLMLKEQVGTAMLSADLGTIQITKILDKTPKRIIFVPDNDETGKSTLDKNIKLMLKYKPPSINPKIYVYVNYGKEKDLSEMGKNSISIDDECIEWKYRNIGSFMERIFKR